MGDMSNHPHIAGTLPKDKCEGLRRKLNGENPQPLVLVPETKNKIGLRTAATAMLAVAGLTYVATTSNNELAARQQISSAVAAAQKGQPTVDQVTTLQEKLKAAGTDLTAAKDQVTTLQGEKTSLQTQVAQLNQSNTNLQVQVGNLQGQIAGAAAARKAAYDSCIKARDVLNNEQSYVWGFIKYHKDMKITCAL